MAGLALNLFGARVSALMTGEPPMWLLIGSLLALAVLVFIVWWTMFSGRAGRRRSRACRASAAPP
jgi:membrane protein implicated in regulation of membrane protease activity